MAKIHPDHESASSSNSGPKRSISFNHPVYNNPNTDITAGIFGQITGTHLSSECQLQGVVRLVF